MTKNASLSNGIFGRSNENEPSWKDVQQNGHKCHAAIPSFEQWRQYKPDQFLFKFAAAVQNKRTISDCYYYVTLPINSHAKVTVVIANIGVRIFAILLVIRMNSDFGMDWTWVDCFMIWVNAVPIFVQFLVFANPLILILICDSWVSSNFNSDLIWKS